MSNATGGVSTQQTIPNILAAKYHAKSQKAIQITNSIATFIAKDLRPYSIVESQEFMALIKTLDPRYTVLSRKHFSDQIIPTMYNRVKNDFQRSLMQAEQVKLSFTYDSMNCKDINKYYST